MDIIQQRSRFSLSGLFHKDANSIFDLIIRGTVYLAVFLVPLFFLTTTRPVFDLNKTLLFSLLTLIGVLAWLGKIVFRKGFRFRRTALDIPVVIFGLLYILVTLFSKDWYTSVVGTANYYHHSVVVVLFLILFYFLVVNNFRSVKDILKILKTTLVAGGFVALISFLQMLQVYIFGSEATKAITFNPVFNSSVVLGIYLAVILTASLSLLVVSKKPGWRLFLIIAGLLEYVVLVLVDINMVWYVLIGLLFVFLLFLTLRSRDIESRWAILPTILLIVAAILTFVNVSAVTNIQIPDDVVLGQGTTWTIAQSTLRQAPLFGTGPEMFSWAFSAHRPLSFNNTNVWNLNFLKGASEFLQILITTGIIVTLVWLWLFVRHGWRTIRLLVKERGDHTTWFVALGVILSWLGLFVVSFFYPFSFVLVFLLWLFLALGVSLFTKDETQVLETKPSPASGFFSSIAFSLLVVLGLAFLYGAVTIWLGDFRYADGSRALISRDYGKAEKNFSRAIDLNGREPSYYYALGQTYVQEAGSISPTTQADIDKARQLITLATAAAKSGLDINSKDALNYQDFVNFSAALRVFDPNVSSQLLEHYDKLIELDPNNPLNYVGAGDDAVAAGQAIENALAQATDVTDEQKQQAQTQTTEYYTRAASYYEKAGTLKNDYVIALLKKALMSELMGQREDAITQVETLAAKYPTNTDVLYELGRMYVATDQKDKAKQEFVAVLNLVPDHANAAYQLAELVLADGDKETAKALFLRVYQNNPNNQTVIDKLKELDVTL